MLSLIKSLLKPLLLLKYSFTLACFIASDLLISIITPGWCLSSFILFSSSQNFSDACFYHHFRKSTYSLVRPSIYFSCQSDSFFRNSFQSFYFIHAFNPPQSQQTVSKNETSLRLTSECSKMPCVTSFTYRIFHSPPLSGPLRSIISPGYSIHKNTVTVFLVWFFQSFQGNH